MDKCLLCGHADLVKAFEAKGAAYFRCNFCGCLLADVKMPTPEIISHYSESYYEGDTFGTAEGRRGYPSYREAEETLVGSFTTKLNLVRGFVASGRLLDAGAAYGFFLRSAAPHFDGEGIDVSEHAAGVARSQTGVRVQAADIHHAPFPDNEFDVVVMWDIIEHLTRPVDALKEVARILKPGGFVFISTDDASNWLPRLLGSRWWALGPPLHLCHFSKKGMSCALERAGLVLRTFTGDPRRYSVAEIIRHFGVSYQSEMLTRLGSRMEGNRLGQFVLRISRPEQFVAIAVKPLGKA